MQFNRLSTTLHALSGRRALRPTISAAKAQSDTPVALFLVYERTAFVDTFRTIRRLKETGIYEPAVLVAGGASKLLEREIDLCRQYGIKCFTEEDIIKSHEKELEQKQAIAAAKAAAMAREALARQRPKAKVADNKASPAKSVFDRGLRTTIMAWIRASKGNVWRQTVRRSPVDFDLSEEQRANQDIARSRSDMPKRRPAWKEALRPFLLPPFLSFLHTMQAWRAKVRAAKRRAVDELRLLGLRSRLLGLRSSNSVRHRLGVMLIGVRHRLGVMLIGVRHRLGMATSVAKDPVLLSGNPSAVLFFYRLRGGLKADDNLNWFGWFRAIIRTDLRYERTLQFIKPAVVCLSEDVLGLRSAPMIRAARRRCIPSVVIPFTIPSPIETLEHCITNPGSEVASPRDDDLLKLMPRWVATYEGRKVLRCHPSFMIGSEMAGIAPVNPFVANSGHADVIAVESERMLEIYQALGFPPQQLAITGSGTDDMLRRTLDNRMERRAELYARLGLPPDKPMLLSTLPNEMTGSAPACEFEAQSELVEFWVKTVSSARDKFNVVLKVDPRHSGEGFQYLESSDVKIAGAVDTAELVPLATVYVTSISPTLRWAAACGIPAISYECRCDTRVDLPGIMYAETKEEFADVIARVRLDSSYLEELRRLQQAEAARWGQLDGQSAQRLIELFDAIRKKIDALPRSPRTRHPTPRSHGVEAQRGTMSNHAPR